MVLISFLGWLSEILLICIVLYVLGLPTGFGLATMILIAINVAIVIPSLPANLGIFEAGAVLALTTVGIESNAAISFAIFYHAFHVISTSLVASVVWLWRNYYRKKL